MASIVCQLKVRLKDGSTTMIAPEWHVSEGPSDALMYASMQYIKGEMPFWNGWRSEWLFADRMALIGKGPHSPRSALLLALWDSPLGQIQALSLVHDIVSRLPRLPIEHLFWRDDDPSFEQACDPDFWRGCLARIQDGEVIPAVDADECTFYRAVMHRLYLIWTESQS